MVQPTNEELQGRRNELLEGKRYIESLIVSRGRKLNACAEEKRSAKKEVTRTRNIYQQTCAEYKEAIDSCDKREAECFEARTNLSENVDYEKELKQCQAQRKELVSEIAKDRSEYDSAMIEYEAVCWRYTYRWNLVMEMKTLIRRIDIRLQKLQDNMSIVPYQ